LPGGGGSGEGGGSGGGSGDGSGGGSGNGGGGDSGGNNGGGSGDGGGSGGGNGGDPDYPGGTGEYHEDLENGIIYDHGNISYMPIRILTLRDGMVPYLVRRNADKHQTKVPHGIFPTPGGENRDYTLANNEYILNSSSSTLWRSYAEYGDGIMETRSGASYTINILSRSTGNLFDGVLPYMAFKGQIPPGGIGWGGHEDHEGMDEIGLFLVEIYNDYMAQRGWAPYDAAIDGEPGCNWPGFLRTESAFAQHNSVPPNWQDISRSLWYFSNKRGYGKYSFDYYPAAKELPYRKAPRYEHLEHHEPHVASNPPLTAGMAEEYEHEPYVSPPKFSLPNKSPYGNFYDSLPQFGQWDMVFSDSDPAVKMLDGSSRPRFQPEAEGFYVNDTFFNSSNVSGLLCRNSTIKNGQYTVDAHYNTRNMYAANADRFGVMLSGTTWRYYPKWLYYTVSNWAQFNQSSDWLSLPNDDRCFPGVAWDGTNEGGVGRGSYLHNGRGITAWGSSEFGERVKCVSYSGDPTSEFGGVVQLANMSVLEATGRRQCPYTWHSTKGYIVYHIAM
jgi:hypothetical protein